MDSVYSQCECNDFSLDHMSGRCTKTARYLGRRNGKRILLCGDCTLRKDNAVSLYDANGKLTFNGEK